MAVTRRFDILVIGGGPAGMAAAARAAECGARVGIVDDNPKLGGQIWRGESEPQGKSEAGQWADRLRRSGATRLCGMRVFHQPHPGILSAEGSDDRIELGYQRLILATGARERFLPFPGWTLPNVMGAGGLQAMVKSGLPIRGKRVVIAGTGPLLLAVAAYLLKHGAEIPVICEQASWGSLAAFAMSLARQPRKIFEALQLKRELAGVPFLPKSWPVAAYGQRTLEKVTIALPGRTETISCDYLACGFHLVPNIELPMLLGCQVRNGCVMVDELQRTNLPDIFCAGEPTGIGGLELALVEGQIAGLAAANQASMAQGLFRQQKSARRFAKVLDQTFQLRPELRTLPQPETIVCRCEDVPYSRLRQHSSWRAAKLQSRCGMGPCQGRICGPATQFLLKWNPDSVRPPVFPARVESLATITDDSELVGSEVTGGH
jgi:NADPH-dependent 2,4-dienoyl-CoA reductase/sulfur reductase-like enzyme